MSLTLNNFDDIIKKSKKGKKIMKNKKQDNEYLTISDSISMKSDAPFYGSVFDFITFEKLIKEYFKSVKELNNPRHVVLETWLLVDFTIRTLLSSLFKLTRFNSEEEGYDLRYELLPISFDKCKTILQKVLKIQRSLPEEPVDNSIKLDTIFGIFFMKKYKNDFMKFLDIEQEYYKKYYPELVNNNKANKVSIEYSMPIITKSDIFKSPKRYCVNKSFVKSLNAIDDNWFNTASKLNRARNKAAHSYDSQEILSKFGYKGKDAAEKTIKECLTMIEKLLGVVKQTKTRSIDKKI